MTTKTKPVIPDVYKFLPNSTQLNSRDVAEIFGHKGIHGMCKLEQTGRIPKRDETHPRTGLYKNPEPRKAESFWLLGTIRKWVAEHEGAA